MFISSFASALLAATSVGAYKLTVYQNDDYTGPARAYSSDGSHIPP